MVAAATVVYVVAGGREARGVVPLACEPDSVLGLLEAWLTLMKRRWLESIAPSPSGPNPSE